MRIKDLKLENSEILEKRLFNVLNFLSNQKTNYSFRISSFEATGKTGVHLTEILNDNSEIEIKLSDLLTLVSEDGQVIECFIKIKDSKNDLIVIRVLDGMIIEIQDYTDIIPDSVLGKYELVT